MFQMFAISLLFFCGFAMAQQPTSGISEEIQKLQAQMDELHNSGVIGHPVVILDRDQLFFETMKIKAFGKATHKELHRKRLINQFIIDRSDMALTGDDLTNLEIYTYTFKESALAMPILETPGQKDLKGCVVIPRIDTSHKDLENGRLLGMDVAEAYAGSPSIDQFSHKLTYQEATLLSLYHEAAHCLDEKYLPEVASTASIVADPQGLHQAESFAEALATLLLYKMGHEQIAQRRAIIRGVYADKIGTYFAQNPHLGFHDEYFVSAGAVYYLTPVLLATSELILFNQYNIPDWSTKELIEKTIQLTDTHALNQREFAAIRFYLGSEDRDATIAEYQDNAWEYPELFYSAHFRLMNFISITKTYLERAFAPIDEESEDSQKETALIDYSPASLCESLENYTTFKSAIGQFRQNLRESSAPYAELKQREIALMSAHQDIQKVCLGEGFDEESDDSSMHLQQLPPTLLRLGQ